jgi:hypothetical protein
VTRVLALLCVLTATSGCRRTNCEDLEPVAVEGSYRGGGQLGEEALGGVQLEAKKSQVHLTYTARDGSRIRATYQVKKKRRLP